MVFMGNLSVRQIERRFGFKFTEEERSRLEELHHPNADFKDGETGWHMFDIPEFLAISKGDVGREVLGIFKGHDDEINGCFMAGYANENE